MSTLIIVEGMSGLAPTWMFATRPSDIKISSDPVPSWAAKATRQVFVLNGLNVDHSVVRTVSRSDRETRNAALYSLEDKLAEPPEDVHVALGRRIGDTSDMWVAACSRSLIESTIAATAEMGVKDAEVMSDVSLFLDRTDDTVLTGEGRIIVVNGRKALSVDPEIAEDVFPALLDELDIASPILEGYPPSSSKEIQYRPSEGHLETESEELHKKIARQVLAGNGINLRQAGFATRSSTQIQYKRMIPVAVLSGVALLGWYATLVIESANFQSRADAELEDARQLYQTAYPEEGAVADPKAQLARRLSTGGETGPAFTDISAALFGAISSIEGVELVSLNYTETSNEISATLAFASYQSREDLKLAIENRGAFLELGASRQTDTVIVGDVVIGARR